MLDVGTDRLQLERCHWQQIALLCNHAKSLFSRKLLELSPLGRLLILTVRQGHGMRSTGQTGPLVWDMKHLRVAIDAAGVVL